MMRIFLLCFFTKLLTLQTKVLEKINFGHDINLHLHFVTILTHIADSTDKSFRKKSFWTTWSLLFVKLYVFWIQLLTLQTKVENIFARFKKLLVCCLCWHTQNSKIYFCANPLTEFPRLHSAFGLASLGKTSELFWRKFC